jgi:aspartate racemase
MKTLGVIGGIAPPSTIDYYRQLTTRFRARSPDGAYPSILINSIDFQRFIALLGATDREELTQYLVEEVSRLAQGGADAALFASNSPHLVFDEVARQSPIPLISIVEATAVVAEAHGYRRLGLLGAKFTMEGGFYTDVFARRGISVAVPDAHDRAYVHERYFAELVEGRFLEETRTGMSAVIARLREREGVEAVILGGTELPLLFRDAEPAAVPLLDTTSIHVESAVSWLLGETVPFGPVDSMGGWRS